MKSTILLALVTYLSIPSFALVLRRGAATPQPQAIQARQATRAKVVRQLTQPRDLRPRSSPTLDILCGIQPINTVFTLLTDYTPSDTSLAGPFFVGSDSPANDPDTTSLFVDKPFTALTDFALDSECRLYVARTQPVLYPSVLQGSLFSAAVDLRTDLTGASPLTCTVALLAAGNGLTCRALPFEEFNYNADNRLVLAEPDLPPIFTTGLTPVILLSTEFL